MSTKNVNAGNKMNGRGVELLQPQWNELRFENSHNDYMAHGCFEAFG